LDLFLPEILVEFITIVKLPRCEPAGWMEAGSERVTAGRKY
jgi:hypothetical protein